MMDTLQDPLDPTLTVCARCADTGWVRVPQSYVDQRVALYVPPAPWTEQLDDGTMVEHPTPDERAAITMEARRNASKRASLADSWYPCPACNATRFTRWSGGHWDRHHDISACDECQDTRGRPKKSTGAARSRRPAGMASRRDVD